MTTEIHPCDRFDWERIVRRVTMPGPTKLLAMVLAQYGDRTGRGIRPGNPRLAAVCGTSERTVERRLSELRAMGLVDRVRNGGGPGQRAAEYRLTMPSDLLERAEILDPDEVNCRHRSGGRSPVDNAKSPVDSGETPATQVAAVVGPDRPELPPLQAELPPKTGVSPATQVADHQDHPTTPPSKRPTGVAHLRGGPVDDEPDRPPDPEAERQRDAEIERLRAELAAWQAAHAERGQQLDDARALLVELAAAVEGHCDVDHGTSGCPFEVLDRVKREMHLG